METRGLVSCVKVGDDFGLTRIVFAAKAGGINNRSEPFILWWSGLVTPDPPNANLRATFDRWLAILRDAMTNNAYVTITHTKGSPVVISLQMG